MSAVARDDTGKVRSRPATAAAVLADRLAAALVHHEPGWRLPRLTALARRYSVSSSEIDVARRAVSIETDPAGSGSDERRPATRVVIVIYRRHAA